MVAPKLRFPKFFSSWFKSPIISLADYADYRGKTPTKTEFGVFLVTAKNIKQGYIDYEISQEYISPKDYDEVMRRGKPQIGDVLITTEAPLGNIADIDRDDIALAQRVIKYRGKNEILNNSFFKQLLLTETFQSELKNKATGGTVQGIKGSVLHKIKISYPAVEEQTKIANFLSAVDERIQQVSQTHELLNQYKKGVMQKIFSQELRFKDENGEEFGEWGIRRIKEILTIGSGRDYKHLNNGNVPVYGTGGLMTTVDSFLYEGETVCIGRKGTIDKPFFYSGKIWTVDTLFYTHKFIDASPRFVYQLFLTINWKEHNEASGVPSLSKSTIESIIVNIPTLPEQTKIANFLSAIDDKINQAQSQLTALQDYKRGLLQQMFV